MAENRPAYSAEDMSTQCSQTETTYEYKQGVDVVGVVPHLSGVVSNEVVLDARPPREGLAGRLPPRLDMH